MPSVSKMRMTYILLVVVVVFLCSCVWAYVCARACMCVQQTFNVGKKLGTTGQALIFRMCILTEELFKYMFIEFIKYSF